MDLYDRVKRGESAHQTLKKPVAVCILFLALCIGIFAWAGRYQMRYKNFADDLAESTRHARANGAFSVCVSGEAVDAEIDELSDLLMILTGAGAGKVGDAPEEDALIAIDYGDGTRLEIWQVVLENPGNAWTEGPFFRYTDAAGKTYGYDTDQIRMERVVRLFR